MYADKYTKSTNQVHWSPFEGSSTAAMAEEQKKREQILLAAADLFAKKGYTGTSVREIVEAAGVTKPTLYYYFKNKEDLYVQLMDTAVLTFSQIVQESVTQPGSMRARLLRLFSSIYQLFREHVDLLRLVNAIIYGPQGATPAYDLMPTHLYLERVFSEMLSIGIAQGEIDAEDRGEALLLLFGLLRSIQVLLVFDPSHRALAHGDIERAIHFIFDGAEALRRTKETTS